MYKLGEIFKETPTGSAYARSYLDRLSQLMAALDTDVIGQIMDKIDQTSQQGKTVYLMANGGSASVASHFVNDAITGALVEGQAPIRAFALTDNTETVTALANDIGYEAIFEQQLKAVLQPGDLVIALSVSGGSENVVRAVKYARGVGAGTIGWTGFDGGALADLCELSFHVPTTPDEYGPVEDLFSILEHILMTYLAMKRGKTLHH